MQTAKKGLNAKVKNCGKIFARWVFIFVHRVGCLSLFFFFLPKKKNNSSLAAAPVLLGGKEPPQTGNLG